MQKVLLFTYHLCMQVTWLLAYFTTLGTNITAIQTLARNNPRGSASASGPVEWPKKENARVHLHLSSLQLAWLAMSW
jgi:hypothetical protein